MRAVLAESEFISLDEPFKGLDEETKIKTMNYVLEKTKNKTGLLITHDQGEADLFAKSKLEFLASGELRKIS